MAVDREQMGEIRALFFTECEELLEALQDGLEAVSNDTSDAETINVIFRAVHSIKGGAGAFGLSQLVNFAHHFETALDEVRSGTIQMDTVALKLFFRAADLLADLTQAARAETTHAPADLAEIERALEELVPEPSAESGGSDSLAQPPEFQPLTLDLALPGLDTAEASGLVSEVLYFAPTAELFVSGSEPLYLFRALSGFASVTSECDIEKVPPLDQLIVDDFHIGWNIHLSGEYSAQEVDEVFEFVQGLCTFRRGTAEDAPELPKLNNPQFEAGETEATTPNPPPAPTVTSAKSTATIRVDLDRVDRLVNLVGELVINQSMLSQSVAEAKQPPSSSVVQGLEEFMQLTRSLQDSVMRIRAQPVKSLFQRMARIVREASAEVGKPVQLKTVGETTEVDKTVIERLADPLTHMIRNAVDHGLEPAEERLAAGKPEQGTVTISASHRSGRVIIEIADDGAGINRKKVHEIALKKGLISAADDLGEAEIDNLLFLPGFSTASTVSNLSGRGVGMDVVRTSIQALGGRISIASTPGEGSIFTISMPLTLAVMDGMVVEVAGQAMVLPLSFIAETMSIDHSMLEELGRETQVVHIREGLAPLLDLGTELGIREPLEDYGDYVALVISHEGDAHSVLIVDRIIDQRQVVIKGLQNSLGKIPGVAAATILGDGQIALILDPLDITTNALGRTKIAPLALAG